MSDLKIKNCPFCDASVTCWIDQQYQDRHVVECDECWTQRRDEYSMDAAINTWNDRPAEAANQELIAKQQEQIELLREALVKLSNGEMTKSTEFLLISTVLAATAKG